MTPRTRVMVGALATTLGVTAWLAAAPDADEPVPALTRPRTSAARSPVAPDAAPAGERQPWPEPPRAAVLAWSAPPPARAPLPAATLAPVAAPAPPPPAPPPPFPYQLVGGLREGEHLRGLLDGPQRSLVVGDGDLIDGQWRVEHVGPSSIDLVWLPRGVAFSLAYRSS
jgi:hypothetical protein